MKTGAHIIDGGCHFRVWAPNAKVVHVVGEFNNWTEGVNALAKTNDGYWEGIVSNALVGQKYKYLIFDNNDRSHPRIDLAARDTLHSGIQDLDHPDSNAGIILDTSYNWAEFDTPKFEDFIIYQLHVGTFAGYNDDFSEEVRNSNNIAKIKYVIPKLNYIKELGFDAIELLPIQEYRGDRSWGYNPSFFFAPESAYGMPHEYRHFVNEAHKVGLAVIFDVVFNHVAIKDNPFWDFDVIPEEGVYLSGFDTPWGRSPAFWRQEVKDFFLENAKMYFEEYKADGLRFDATRWIEFNRGFGSDGWDFMQYLTHLIKEAYPDKYLIAEHLPDHDTAINSAGFSATWFARAHHEFQRAAQGFDSVNKLKNLMGKDFGFGQNYPNQWNLVKYLLGSHDDCGDDKGGTTIEKDDWEQHRYFTEFFGGRGNWYARAKARLGWALNVAIPGTPMMFMGAECHHWGYWHDAKDQYGDHRFDWSIAGDRIGLPMRRMVTDVNWARWKNPSLRSETFAIVHEDYDNNVLGFKRWVPEGDNVVLVVVNASDNDFDNFSYGLNTGGQEGQWTQIFCSQDAAYDGWDGAGNAYYEPWTQNDERIFINLPKWSVIMMRLKQ